MENIHAALVAEQELQKFKRDDLDEKIAAYALFMKHICGFDLYPTQLLQAEEYFRYPYILEYKPPRSGKSRGKAGINLYELATNEKEDLRIYTPKYSIGKDALKYQYEWIAKSEVLRSFVRIKGGKKQFSTTGYEFMNLSNAEIVTVAGLIEGHNVTIADIMEFDFWDWNIFADDVTRRFAGKNENGLPTRVRIDGTIRGQENIYKIATDKTLSKLYRNIVATSENNILGLPAGIKMDVDLMMALDILGKDEIKLMKSLMSPDEEQMSLYLNFTESRNFIWSKYLLAIFRKSMKWGLEGVPFVKGGKYESSGIVGCGFDCGHAGQKKKSSKYAIEFYEHFNNYRRWLFGKEWPPNYDPDLLEKEVLELLAFFQPGGGYGDALQHNLIASINDKAWNEGLTNICREDNPENTPANWAKWWINPLWNNNKNKHFYYDSLQLGIHKGTCFYPFYEISDTRPEALAMRRLKRSLLNIRKEETNAYPKYYPFDDEIDDDHADAAGMANLWLDVHVQPPINMGIIKSSTHKTVMSDLVSRAVNANDIERLDYNSF